MNDKKIAYEFIKRFYFLRKIYYSIFVFIVAWTPITAISVDIEKNRILAIFSFVVLLVFFISGIIIQNKINSLNCPKCNKKFFSKNNSPASALSFPHQNRCGHCSFKPF